MLVYLLTDARATPRELRRVLTRVCDQIFNCISVDGDTSTNDTVLLLASGKSNVDLRKSSRAFATALLEICQSLAERIVRDGEGVQHLIRLTIDGAKNRAEAMQVASAIAYSPLCKTAWAGADPNWGRILAAVGRSGAPIVPEKVSIFIGKQMVCHHGRAFAFDEQSAHQHLLQPTCDVRVQLGRGHTCLRFLTSDLTSEYIRINADYST